RRRTWPTNARRTSGVSTAPVSDPFSAGLPSPRFRLRPGAPKQSEGGPAAPKQSEGGSDHAALAVDATCRKPLDRKRGELEAGIASDDQIGQDPAGRRRVLKAVAAEPVDHEQAGNSRNRPDNRGGVRRYFVQSRPR